MECGDEKIHDAEWQIGRKGDGCEVEEGRRRKGIRNGRNAETR